jgi:hypothetical protein
MVEILRYGIYICRIFAIICFAFSIYLLISIVFKDSSEAYKIFIESVWFILLHFSLIFLEKIFTKEFHKRA